MQNFSILLTFFQNFLKNFSEREKTTPEGMVEVLYLSRITDFPSLCSQPLICPKHDERSDDRQTEADSGGDTRFRCQKIIYPVEKHTYGKRSEYARKPRHLIVSCYHKSESKRGYTYYVHHAYRKSAYEQEA